MTSTASPGRQCEAQTKRGHRCVSWAVERSRFCFWHDPELAAARKAARSRGGRARHNRTLGNVSRSDQVTLSSVADVVTLVEGAVRDVLTLENSVARARCIGYLCGVATRALEVSDLEQRIAALEDKVGV